MKGNRFIFRRRIRIFKNPGMRLSQFWYCTITLGTWGGLGVARFGILDDRLVLKFVEVGVGSGGVGVLVLSSDSKVGVVSFSSRGRFSGSSFEPWVNCSGSGVVGNGGGSWKISSSDVEGSNRVSSDGSRVTSSCGCSIG